MVSLLLRGLEWCLAQSGCVAMWSEHTCGCGGARGPSACGVLQEMVIRLPRELSFPEQVDPQGTSRGVHTLVLRIH